MKILEDKKSLSESMLWQLQDAAYHSYSMSAWSSQGVPSYLTSHPLTARYYAAQALSYLRSQNLNEEHPVYIFDLGAGTGRFAFLFLQELFRELERAPLPSLRIQYVMTDIIEENLRALQSHRCLATYLQQGLIDFALFRHDQPEITLLRSGITLTSALVKNPLVLVANYFFDTIPQDIYRTVSGQLQKGYISLAVEEDKTEQADLIPLLKASFSYDEAIGPLYPHHPAFDRFLTAYAQQLCNATIMFPVGALECLETFRGLSGDRLLLLAADQGISSTEQAEAFVEPIIARHGSFSIQVSYHLLSRYFSFLGGEGLTTEFPDSAFVLLTGLLDRCHKAPPALVAAFGQTAEAFEPSDYLRLSNLVEAEWAAPSLSYLLTLLKLGNWDPINFHLFYLHIERGLASCTSFERKFLCYALRQIRARLYPISPEEGVLFMNIGVLFYQLGEHAEALISFEEAFHYIPTDPQLLINLAACAQNKPSKSLDV